MPRLTLRQEITALIVATVLAAPLVAVAAPSARQETARSGLWGEIWIVFADFWGSGMTPDDGCRMDPSGSCATMTLADGCSMDPDGHCIAGRTDTGATVTPDDGCQMDPNSGCAPSR